MYQHQVMNETVIRDIVSLIADGRKQSEDYGDFITWGKGAKHSFRSITKASSDLVMTFPILVSDTVDVENAVMIMKSHERKCAAMMHMLFSALCISSDSENVYDYLRQFHSNINFAGNDLNVDYFNDTMDSIADKVDESVYDTRQFKEYSTKVLQESLMRLNEIQPIIDQPINETSIGDYSVSMYKGKNGECIIMSPIQEGGRRVGGGGNPHQNAFTRDLENRAEVYYSEHPDSDIDTATRDIFDQLVHDRGGRYNGAANRERVRDAVYAARARVLRDRSRDSTTTRITRDYKYKTNPWSDDYKNTQAGMQSANSRLASPFVNTDIRKANELLPTMLVIHFYSPAVNEPVSAVIGIKAKLYPIKSQEMINRLTVRNKDNQGFHNFLRAATRETAFFKDFVFAVDKAKIDALSNSNRGSDSKIWKILERRAIKSKVRRGMGMYNDATAITTVCITDMEVDRLQKEYQLDIMNPRILKPILDAYNLMGFVVIDPNMETCRFWYDDGSNTFDTMSFSSLERESNDQNYKKVINLMTKMAR